MVRSLPELSQNLQRLRPSPSGEPRCAALEKLLLDADHSLQAPAQIAALVSQWVDVEVAAVPSPGAEPRAVERNRSFSQLVGASLSSISPIRLFCGFRDCARGTGPAPPRTRRPPPSAMWGGHRPTCAAM